MQAACVATIVCAVAMAVPVVSASPVYSRRRDEQSRLDNKSAFKP